MVTKIADALKIRISNVHVENIGKHSTRKVRGVAVQDSFFNFTFGFGGPHPTPPHPNVGLRPPSPHPTPPQMAFPEIYWAFPFTGRFRFFPLRPPKELAKILAPQS